MEWTEAADTSRDRKAMGDPWDDWLRPEAGDAPEGAERKELLQDLGSATQPTADGQQGGLSDSSGSEREEAVQPDANANLERGESRQELGDRGEALVVRILVEAEQHDLLYQHAPGERPQGVDVVTLDPGGRLVVTEVKTTAADRYRQPHTSRNVADHQLDPDWTSKNLTRTGHVALGAEAIGPAADQVFRQLAQFDTVSGTVSFWDITHDGQRAGSSPREVWDASDFENRG